MPALDLITGTFAVAGSIAVLATASAAVIGYTNRTPDRSAIAEWAYRLLAAAAVLSGSVALALGVHLAVLAVEGKL